VTDVLNGLGAAERARVAELRSERRFFWLDASLSDTSRDALAESLGTPEEALRALPGSGDTYASRTVHADGETVSFTLRCYVDSGAPADEAGYRLQALDVRVVVTGDYLLTLHAEPVSLPTVLAPELPEERSKRYVVYAVLDAILKTTFDALAEVEMKVEALAAIWADGSGGRLPRTAIRTAGARLATMRRWVTAHQAVVERLAVDIGALPGFATDQEPYFDRLDEQVDRLPAAIDAAADGMGMLLDLQLNERAYVVSVIATIFGPLTFLTGFFGMNFGWMVDHIDSPGAFWLLGIVIPVAAVAVSWRFLLRQFLMGDDRKARSR
jgi:magnesium transporter